MQLFKLSCTLAALAAATLASGAALRITPVGVEVLAPATAGAISLTNEAADPVNLQIRVFRWTQVDGADRLEPSDAVIVSPPAATVKAGETYTIRAMRADRHAPAEEESYRLLIDEIPAPIAGTPAAQGVRMVLRTSLPVFFAPAGLAPQLRWTARITGQQVELEARNTGRHHVRLSRLTLAGLNSPVSFGDGLNGYVLPGATMRFTAPVTGSVARGALSLTADTDAGPITAPVAFAGQ